MTGRHCLKKDKNGLTIGITTGVWSIGLTACRPKRNQEQDGNDPI
jgi:hypothetical protein